MTSDPPPGASAPPALRFGQVHKRFGQSVALAGLTLTVEAGESFGLAGVNGAGKTTLIKCLLDFCSTDGGAIRIFGVSHLTTVARARLAFLPERFNPPYYLSGRDFLRYIAKLQGTPYHEDEAQAMLAGSRSRPERAHQAGARVLQGDDAEAGPGRVPAQPQGSVYSR